jgi:hypothetical protein
MRQRDPADPPRGALPSWPDDGEAGDLRSGRRVGLRHPCKLIMLRDRSTRTCELHDLSIDGLSFTSIRPVAPGTRLQVEFDLTLDEQPCTVRVVGRSSYSSFQGSEGFRIGVRFLEVDEASRQAIREFVERARGAGGGSTRPVPLDGAGS